MVHAFLGNTIRPILWYCMSFSFEWGNSSAFELYQCIICNVENDSKTTVLFYIEFPKCTRYNFKWKYLCVTYDRSVVYYRYDTNICRNFCFLSEFSYKELLLKRNLLNQVEVITFMLSVAVMNWLIVTEYLCRRCPWICSVCRSPTPVLFNPFKTFHRI